MSLGSHIITRSSLPRSLQVDLLAAPRDHLLFLYSRWLSSKRGTFVVGGKGAPGPYTQYKPPTTGGGNAHSSIKTAGHHLESLPITIGVEKQLRKLSIAHCGSRLAATGIPKQAASLFGDRTHGAPVQLQKRHFSLTTSEMNSAGALSQTSATSYSESTSQEAIAIQAPTTSNEHGKSLVRIVRVAKHRQRHLADKASVNLQLKNKSILSYDWRVPLKLLEQHTRSHESHSGEGVERVLIYEDVIPVFARDVRETLWDIKVRSGCEMHILGEEEAIGLYRPVLLRGSPSSIEMAKEVVSEWSRQLSLGVREHNGDMLLCGAAALEYKESEPLLVRNVWVKDRKLRQIRVGDIPCPEAWTTLSFADYVADLVKSTVSRSMGRHLYKKDKPHVIVVREKVVELFTNPRYDDIISVQAFNDTLNFLYKHNMISTMRTLFVRMESLRLRMLPETFNIMLRSAAVRRDLHHYTTLLRLMIQKGYQPNEGSWVALLMTVPSRRVQLRIESGMREKGLLRSPATVRGITTHTVPAELIGHLNSGQDLPNFIKRIDGTYGPDWMSVSSLNRVLDVLGERGSFSQALNAITLFLERNIRPNTVSLNTLLSHCRRQGDLNEAVQLMHHFTLDLRVPADGITYHNLFMLAWEAQQYNVCRTVWRRACMKAAVSYRMQELMLRSLFRNTPSKPNTRGEMWMVSAAKVIAGVAPKPGTVAKLVGWSETGHQRAETLALAKEVLAQDLAAVLRHRPARPFTRQLTKALAVDRLWTRTDLWKKTSTMWKLENAVKIPLIPRSAC